MIFITTDERQIMEKLYSNLKNTLNFDTEKAIQILQLTEDTCDELMNLANCHRADRDRMRELYGADHKEINKVSEQIDDLENTWQSCEEFLCLLTEIFTSGKSEKQKDCFDDERVKKRNYQLKHVV